MTDAAPRMTSGRKTAILVIVLASYFMILLDNSVIFTALPSMEADLGLTVGQTAWVQDAYTLVFGGLLLLGARASDILGRKPVFIGGLIVFSVASLLVGMAPTGGAAIAARALQGIGAAIVAPSSLSLITASFPAGHERNRAVALYGATAGIGASLGLVVGGLLASAFSWRAGFYVNVPIGIVMILMAPRFLPASHPVRGRFDVVGAIAATLGVGALVFATIHAAEASWGAPLTIGSLVGGLALIALLVWNEARAAQPIMPLRLFDDRVRVGGYVGRLLFMGAMIGFFFFTTQFMQDVLGFTPLQAGLGFLPMTAVNFAVALASPRIARRVGEAPALVAGVAVTMVGMLWLSRIGVDSTYVTDVALPMVLIGAGQGLVFAPLTSAGIHGASEADAGAASGLVNTFHQLGMALGLGILVVVGSHAVGAGVSGVEAVAVGASASLAAGTALLLASLVVCAALILPAARREATDVPATASVAD
ncbi:MFS transporter [Demequina sp. NBRC 110057]|uniref:MFS transporter n=1 Tax=Demequina sp. NBRC 110057 TaxID=1570346 RepID=UPI000A00E78B|nr:MFS transporter [Demequina sp. NBRC 110057]